ncbi:MAG: hypothetical protein PH343_07295, partial [Nitrospira sp.]|nr:hypothetical protein [Nitrospira sp.]
MPRLNEITSTEKLLNLIRGKDNKISEKPHSFHGGFHYKKFLKNPFNKIIPRNESATLGIDIGYESLRLVKITRTSDNKWRLLDWKCVPIPVNISKWSAEFAAYLKSEILLFCSSVRGLNIWILMSAANVEVRHIRIPKVSKKEIANAVYWTVKKEVPFDEKENFIDFELHGEIIDQGITKLLIMAYIAPVKEVEDIKSFFAKIDLPLSGITIVPFAIQNIFRPGRENGFGGRYAILFIGNDFSRIDIYDRRNLVMTRDIKAGTNSMIDSLIDEISLRQKSSGTAEAGIHVDREDARKMLFSLDPESHHAQEKDFPVSLKSEEIFAMTLPALERAVRQVERTFGHYAAQSGNEKVEHVYVSGVLSVYKPLVNYVGEQLGIKSETLDVFNQQVCSLDEDEIKDVFSDRVAFIPALGAALSENKHTLNLKFTYKDKENESDIKRLNRNIFIAFASAFFICAVILGYQGYVIRQKKIELTRLEKKMPQNIVYVKRDMVRQMVSTINGQQAELKLYSKRYMGVAVVGELSALTPPDIGLTRLRVSLGSLGSGEKKTESDGGASETVLIDGLIKGDRNYAEAALSR